MPRRISLFNIPITDTSLENAVQIILQALNRESCTRIYFANAHCVNIAQRDNDYFHTLQQADYVFADGMGMKLAAKIQQDSLQDNVNGTDLYPRLCQALEETRFRVFLLGGAPGIAEAMKQEAGRNYPGLTICGVLSGPITLQEQTQLIETIRTANTDLLLVALGVPKQEKWIARFAEKAGTKVAMGVGGLFDFYSGNIPRAPVWMRRLGLEWCYRLYQEPGRMWKRYLLGNIEFLWLAVKQRCNINLQ